MKEPTEKLTRVRSYTESTPAEPFDKAARTPTTNQSAAPLAEIFMYGGPTVIDALGNREIRVSPAADFNDPFDGLPAFRRNIPAADKVSGLKDLESTRQLLCMACFSKASDNVLMWSHYAGGHTGLVLGFDRGHAMFKDCTFDVTYSKRRSKVSGKGVKAKKHYEALVTALNQKSDYWKYEQEVRYIANAGVLKVRLIQGRKFWHVKFAGDALKSVTFGLNASPSLMEQVKRLLWSSWDYQHVGLWQMVMEHHSFCVFREKVEKNSEWMKGISQRDFMETVNFAAINDGKWPKRKS